MITEEIREYRVFITTDGTEFPSYSYYSEENARKVAETYESKFNNPVDKTFNHGFVEGDIVFFTGHSRRIRRALVLGVHTVTKAVWVDPITDRWYHNEPAELDELELQLIGGDENDEDRFLEFTGNEILFLKKSIEELLID